MAYEASRYNEYFVIDEGYYPEINESSIKDPKNKWQNTFPHADIVSLLKLVERALSRSDKKSLWLEGSYGTGKSRIIWMMQNLLTCSEKEFDDYFNEYDNLRGEIDLRERLRGIRNGKVVTTTRYATGDITSTQKLIFAVFESLTGALKKNGCKFDGAKTLRGKIADWLEKDNANLEMFRAKIKKPEYRMSATLVNRSAEEIIERLKNPKAEVAQLVEEILRLGEREGIRAFNIDMGELIDWISEVIAENNLKAIVFFWDEFSRFFGNNRNNLDEFQRLAELSNIAPFYLVIATHESGGLVGVGAQAFKTLGDRFTHKEITMPDNIALELIGHALKVKDFAQNEWELISEALRERTATPRKAVMKFAKIRNEKILTDILPIHPIAAVLLKNLAAYFASNQRSIFNFIKNTDPNVEAFQEFIATKSPYEGDLLTIDYLWNFFYENGVDEHGGNVGRMNLKLSIRTILDSYALNKEHLNSDEQIVLKTVLLFQAIDQEAHGSVEIFRPTEKNLELAFTGIADMENGRAISIANELVRKEILFKKPGKVEMFAAMAINGDITEIERLKKDIVKNISTADLVEAAKLPEEIPLTMAQKMRFVLYPVTAENFTMTLNRIAGKTNGYKIQVAVIFARDEEDKDKIYKLMGEAIHNEAYKKIVLVDASANLISHDIFSRWLENTANEKYWRGKDNYFANQLKSNADDCLREWRDFFAVGSFVYYPAQKKFDETRRGISCRNVTSIVEEMADNVRRLYPYSFDNADIVDTLFQATNLKRLPTAGIKQEEFSMLKTNQIKIILGDLWQMSEKYWEVYPGLSISRLKVEVDALIEKTIEKESRISFDKIFECLLEHGFMPVNVYAFLTGFLLKEYADDPYRFSAGIDGNQGGTMSATKLAECIYESIKHAASPARNHRSKYLEIMSQNQRQFMEFATAVFDVSENVSVEQSAQKLRTKLNKLGYPLWCYVEAAKEKYKKFLGFLARIANSKEADSISDLAERAGKFLTDNPKTLRELKSFLTADKGCEILSNFLKEFEGGIIFQLAQKIGIENVVAECRRRLSAGDGIWLRDKETAEEDLRKVIVDYKIIVESQKFGIGGKTLNACAKNWADYCRFNLKMPAAVYGDYYPVLKKFFAVLKEVAERGEIAQSKREIFWEQLVENTESIEDVLAKSTQILREKYSYQLNGFSDEELQELNGYLPNSSFTDSQGNHHRNVNEYAKKIKSKQLKNELLRLWQSIVGTNTPREWSQIHRTPILVMVPASEQDIAKKVFNTVMASSPEEKDVHTAIEYLEKKPSYFSALNDERQIEENFERNIVGEEHNVLSDNDEIRDELEVKVTSDAYQWYPNVQTSEVVKEFAKNKYYSGGAYDKVTEQVRNMSDSDAKKLLIELVDKNYEVGLKLLRES